MFPGERPKPEVSEPSDLLAPSLRSRGACGQRVRPYAKLIRDECDSGFRDRFARTQHGARITERTELQREPELVGTAAATLDGPEIAGALGPVPDEKSIARSVCAQASPRPRRAESVSGASQVSDRNTTASLPRCSHLWQGPQLSADRPRTRAEQIHRHRHRQTDPGGYFGSTTYRRSPVPCREPCFSCLLYGIPQ